MVIHRLLCDYCATQSAEFEPYVAGLREAVKDSGWRRQRITNTGVRLDVCPVCVHKGRNR